MIELPPFKVPTGADTEMTPFDAAWSDVRDALLRGLTHALSNRVMAITTLAELTSSPPSLPDARASEVLTAESHRLDALLRQFRMLSASEPSQPEPLHIDELIPAVVALAGRHPETADLPSEVDASPPSPLAWGDLGRIQRTTLILIVAATRAARRARVSTVRVRTEGDDRAVIVSVRAGRPGSAAFGDAWPAGTLPAPGDHQVLMDAGADGSVRYALRVPSLAEARRRGA